MEVLSETKRKVFCFLFFNLKGKYWIEILFLTGQETKITPSDIFPFSIQNLRAPLPVPAHSKQVLLAWLRSSQLLLSQGIVSILKQRSFGIYLSARQNEREGNPWQNHPWRRDIQS